MNQKTWVLRDRPAMSEHLEETSTVLDVQDADSATWQSNSLVDRSTWIGSGLALLIGTLMGARLFSTLSRFAGFDQIVHANLVIKSRNAETQLGYSLYYSLLDAVAAGGDLESLLNATTAVLAVSFGLRIAVTWLMLSFAGIGIGGRVVGTITASVAGPILLSSSEQFYFGKLTPVVWHNSTTILAAPFALLLFVSTCWVLSRRLNSWTSQTVQAVLVVLSALAKPNYLLALVPAVAVWCLIQVVQTPRPWRLAKLKELGVRAAPTFSVAAAVLLIQYWLTYGGPGLQIEGQRVSNVWRPFALWEIWHSDYGIDPLWCLFASVVTPLVLTILVWRIRLYRLPLTIAWSAVAVGLLEFSLLAESLEDGSTLFHGNWIWGAQSAMTVLFVVTLATYMREFSRLTWLKWVGFLLVAYQVVSGLRWLLIIQVQA